MNLVFLCVVALCIINIFPINSQKLNDKVNNAKEKIKNVDINKVEKKIKKGFKSGKNCDCGISEIDENDKDQIHPWQVLLTINWKKNLAREKDVYCQGTLISKKHIVTSLYCLQERIEFTKTRARKDSIGTAIVGFPKPGPLTSRCKSQEKTGNCRNFKGKNVEKFSLPSIKNKNNPNSEHFIALIILPKPFQLSDKITPICLPKTKDIFPVKENIDLTVQGWNKIQPQRGPSGIAYVELKVFPKDCPICKSLGPPRLCKFDICVKRKPGSDVIRESSGAGIYFEDEEREKRFFLVGILAKDDNFLKPVLIRNMVVKKTLKWLRNGVNRKQVKKCKYKPKLNDKICGKSDVDETELNPKMHPWQVTIFINWKKNLDDKESSETPDESENGGLDGNKDIICQGVLVSVKHVLTAYHCLVDKERKSGGKRNFKDVRGTVQIGQPIKKEKCPGVQIQNN